MKALLRATARRRVVAEATSEPDGLLGGAFGAQPPRLGNAEFPKAAARLDAAQHDLLAFTACPREIWQQIWSNNPQEQRLNKSILPHGCAARGASSRTEVVGIFPDRTAVIRLVGSVLAEQNDEWTETRRHVGRGSNSSRHHHRVAVARRT